MTGKIIGIALIVMGVLMIIYTGVNFVTTENVLDVGPLQVNREKNHFLQWSPVVGVALILGGVVAMVVGRRTDR